MKKILALFVVLISCENETDPCEGMVLDVIQQSLVIAYVDSDGNNLIENGTYTGEEIFTERDGFKFHPVVLEAEEIPDIPEALENAVIVDLFKLETEEAPLVFIHLNENEIDVLNLDLRVESTGCSGSFYDILGITYNEESKSFQDIGNNYYKITIVK